MANQSKEAENTSLEQIEVPNTLIVMINALPRVSDRVFPTKYRVISGNYIRMMK